MKNKDWGRWRGGYQLSSSEKGGLIREGVGLNRGFTGLLTNLHLSYIISTTKARLGCLKKKSIPVSFSYSLKCLGTKRKHELKTGKYRIEDHTGTYHHKQNTVYKTLQAMFVNCSTNSLTYVTLNQ